MSCRTLESLENQGRQLLASRLEAAGFTHAEEHTIDMLMLYTMEYLGACVEKGLERAFFENRETMNREDLKSAIDNCAGRFGGLAPTSTEAEEWLKQHREQQGRGPIVVTDSCMADSSSSTAQLAGTCSTSRSASELRRVPSDRQGSGSRQFAHRLRAAVAEPPPRLTSHMSMWGEMSWCYTCGQERQGRFCSECSSRLGAPVQSIPSEVEEVLPLPQEVIERSGVDEARRKADVARKKAEEAEKKAHEERSAAEAAVQAVLRKCEEVKKKLATDQEVAEAAAEAARKSADVAKEKAAQDEAAAKAAAEAAIKEYDSAKKKAAHEQEIAEAKAESAKRRQAAAEAATGLLLEQKFAAEAAAKQASEVKASAQKAAEAAAASKAAAEKEAAAAAEQKATHERAFSEAAAQSAGEEKASGQQFMVTLDRTDGTTLGVRMHQNSGNALMIETISAGLIVDWNALHRDQPVAPGDSFVKVNDACKKAAMISEMKQNQVLHILVHKSSPASAKGTKRKAPASSVMSGEFLKRAAFAKKQAATPGGKSVASDADKPKPAPPQRPNMRAQLKASLARRSAASSTRGAVQTSPELSASQTSVSSSSPPPMRTPSTAVASKGSALQAAPSKALPAAGAQPASSSLAAPPAPATRTVGERKAEVKWAAEFTSASTLAFLLGREPTKREASEAIDDAKAEAKSDFSDELKDEVKSDIKDETGSQIPGEAKQEAGAAAALASGIAAATRRSKLRIKK